MTERVVVVTTEVVTEVGGVVEVVDDDGMVESTFSAGDVVAPKSVSAEASHPARPMIRTAAIAIVPPTGNTRRTRSLLGAYFVTFIETKLRPRSFKQSIRLPIPGPVRILADTCPIRSEAFVAGVTGSRKRPPRQGATR
jgi:hypothetical protein